MDECCKAAGALGIDPAASLLLTDLYELNMYAAYLEAGMTDTAVFEFFVRKLPRERNFLLAAGLEQVLQFLEQARFTEAELAWLEASGRFDARTLASLAAFRFTGEVYALPEGTAVFPDEPILGIEAPLPEAQLLESRLINLLHFQTLIASKAARMVLAAPGKLLLDFGLRRAHGAEAGLLAARAAYLAGFAGTATMLAEPLFGVPVYGTMAHSFIQAHEGETLAFERFARARPDQVTLLLDTYDTEAAAKKVVSLAPRLARDGITVRGVRLDSGDLAAHARQVRAILDQGGLPQVRIFASGGLDEWQLRELEATAPIDGYGIGTSLTTSERRAGARLRVQTAGLCRCAEAQALRGQGHLARPQADLPPSWHRRATGRRHHYGRRRRAARRAAAPAGDAGTGCGCRRCRRSMRSAIMREPS